MSLRVDWTPHSQRDLNRLDRPTRARIVAAVLRLAETRQGDVIKLAGKHPVIKARVHAKVFRVGTQVSCWSPQVHGDFGDFPFWDEQFWSPSVDSGKDSPIRRLDNVNCPPRP